MPLIKTSFVDASDRRTLFNVINMRGSLPAFMGNTWYLFYTRFHRDISAFKLAPHTQSDPSILSLSPADRVKNVILVIGESDFPNRHTIYGYKSYNTTPTQQSLLDQKRLCVIQNSHSSANLTQHAFPTILSFGTPSNQEKMLEEKNIIENANDAGYDTWFIGSQSYDIYYDMTLTYNISYSKHLITDNNFTENNIRLSSAPFMLPHMREDLTLIPGMERAFQSKSPFKFFIIHLSGSHASYTDKYNEDDERALPNAPAYDKSLHHTDVIIKKIVSLADTYLKDYTLLYTPDHGEVVDVGHALEFGGYDQYKIPVFFIGNDHEKYCDMANEMRNSNGYYTQTKDKFILLKMLGYKIDPHSIDEDKKKDQVIHSPDGKVYNYEDIPTEK